MTMSQEGEGQQATIAEETPYYWVDPSRFAEMNRSLEVMLLSRRCRSCKEQPVDVANPPPVGEQVKHIVECCAQDESFIRPGMPLQEIVFRLIIGGGNHPLSLEGLHYQLTEQWVSPANPMNISQEGLKRVLDNDEFYGFREVSAEEIEQM